MSKWKNNMLDLGALGTLEVLDVYPDWTWEWVAPNGGRQGAEHRKDDYRSPEQAQSAAEFWLRRALKQAARRLEG